MASSAAMAGSGFELRSQSAAALGTALAGATAGSADPTTFLFNPASLAQGNGTEAAIVVTGLSTGVEFSGSASTLLGTPVGGNQGGNAGTAVAAPNLYFAAGLSDSVRIGLAIAPRFGLGSYWDDDWIGRYHALNSALQTLDIMPSASLRISPWLSVGVAVDAEYAKIKVTNAIDFGTVDQVLFGGALGGMPAGNDGLIRSTADSWAFGFAVGVLYEPVQGTRIGVAYHSAIKQRLQGNASFDLGGPVGQTAAALSGAFTATSIRSELKLPASASIGIYHELDGNWAVMADIKWSGWHALQSLDVTFGNPAQPSVQTQLAWQDSWYAALGARYRVNDRFALRMGAAYDQAPTRDEARTPAIPDSDSYWVASGFEYYLSPGAKLDVSYGHIFATDTVIDLSALGPGNAFRGNLDGRVRNSAVDYLSLAVAYRI